MVFYAVGLPGGANDAKHVRARNESPAGKVEFDKTSGGVQGNINVVQLRHAISYDDKVETRRAPLLGDLQHSKILEPRVHTRLVGVSLREVYKLLVHPQPGERRPQKGTISDIKAIAQRLFSPALNTRCSRVAYTSS